MGAENWTEADEAHYQWRQAERERWAKLLRREVKRLGLDEVLVLDHLERQRFCCGLCSRASDSLLVDLDDERMPRGLLCGWCLKYIKAIETDPLRGPKPRRKPMRKARALVYLGFVTPRDT